ncbi:MAG: DMT family transporter, partial [Prevotella sp.]|nr:DMT family transporter [Prevotella sp.]
MIRKDVLAGHAAMLCANVMWGLMSPIGKEALNSPDISALTLTGLRIIGAAVLFWLGGFLLPSNIAPKETIEKKDWGAVIVAALLITFANQMCVIVGMSMTSPIDATMMCSTTPFFTLILAWLLWKVRHPWAKIAG